MTRGRPLRFLGGVLAGWTGVRVAMLWPAALPSPALVAAPVLAEPRPAPIFAQHARPPTMVASPVRVSVAGTSPFVAKALSSHQAESVMLAPLTAAPLPPPGIGVVTVSAPLPVATATDPPRATPLPVPQPVFARPRLAGDSWLVLRPGGGDSLAFGQLGASQGGARLTWAVDEDRRVALSGRMSAPIRGAGRELGLGVDVRPTRLPVHLLVEERLSLDGGGSRPAAGMIAAASATLSAGARLDAYGQAGAVLRRGGFADGAALVSRPVLERHGLRLELGGGAWGAAQRRAARLDVGPSVALVAPAGPAALRLGLDYRVRLAGRARPGSGPALTLGGSF